MKIAYNDYALSVRGTTVALYDYAYNARATYGYDGIIMYDRKHPATDPRAVQKFEREFPVFSYDTPQERDRILRDNRCDALFTIKTGRKDGFITSVCPNWTLAISTVTEADRHGERYAVCSLWLAKMAQWKLPCVPHMVTLPPVTGDIRSELEIPKDAVVLGRNGGWETFDIPWAKQAVIASLSLRQNLYYLFQNTEPFVEHPRVRWLGPSADMDLKVKFINSCDALLHARQHGESFGLTIGEFSHQNKRVITFRNSVEQNHNYVLGEKGIYYSDYHELLKILLEFTPTAGDWNCFRSYAADKVIARFKQYYIDGIG